MQASTLWSPSPAVAVLRRAVGLVGLAALRRMGPVDRPRVDQVDLPRVDQVARPGDGLTVLPRVDQVARPRDGLTVLPSAGGRRL